MNKEILSRLPIRTNLQAICFLAVIHAAVSATGAQTLTTGAIAGTVVDPSSAVVPKVVVTATNANTGATRTVMTSTDGTYLLAQLDPGNYKVAVQSSGFATTEIGPITVAVGRIASVNFSLKVGTATEHVVVNTDAPLIEPSNPNKTTTLNSRQLAEIPNPGNDLSYVATLTPGAVLNTNSARGFVNGNVEFNGLPSVANDFSIDGLDANNPLANLNATGASGLQLGLNAIQEVTVNTTSYATDQGRLGAAQINFVTKSGTNSFHGNAYEIWNGSAMNSRNFFNNAKGISKKPRSNVNEFGASVGGPILKNKLFFFTDLEGIRIVLPTTLTSTLPTPAYQTYVLQQLPLGGRDPVLSTQLPPQPAEVPFYQNIFKLMGDTSGGIPLAVLGCPLNLDGTLAGGNPPNGAGCATTKTFSVAPPANETLFTIKLDYTRSPKDTFWFRFQLNNGSRVQVDPVNPIFNVETPVQIRSGAAGWTHVFSPTLVNQFNPGISYTSSISNLPDPAKALATIPIAYATTFGFSSVGGSLFSSPSGAATTVWQLTDNLTRTRDRHDLKFGLNFRRLLFSTFDTSVGVIPLVLGLSLPEFTFGATGSTSQFFPKQLEYRIAGVNLDTYAMDTFRATSKLTITLGIRAAWNSNFISRQGLLSRLNGSFETIPHDVNRSLNLEILPNEQNLFASTPPLQWEPRVAIAYELRPNTVLRMGFGIFGNPLTGNLPSQLELNAPSDNSLSAGLFNPLGGVAIAPGVPNSAVDAAVAANQRFQAGFSSGTLSCASPLASQTNCLPPINFTTFPSGRQEYPYSMQWSSGIDRQFGRSFGLTVRYVGTRGLKMLFNDHPNGFQRICLGCFAPFPFNAPADPRFTDVFAYHIGANSSYHGLQITAEKRVSRGLALRVNYAYSHCLDTGSNGGVSKFNQSGIVSPLPGELRRLYGNCDFDIRNSVNGFYTYELPFHSKRGGLDRLVGGWQISGTIFLRGGLPFSILSAPFSGRFSNTSPPTLFANGVPGQNPYAQASMPGVTQPGTIQWLNPNAFQSVVDRSTGTCFPTNSPQNCHDGDLSRNSLRGPGFRWTDLSIGKRFRITERLAFRLDTQFFNLFNHPNFALPSSATSMAGIPGKGSTLTGFGTINATVSPNTGLLGSRLGGDSSVRMIAFKGSIQF